MAWQQHKETVLKAYREVSHVIWWLTKKGRWRKEQGLEYRSNEIIQSEARTEKGTEEEKRHKDQWDSIECAKTYVVLVPYAKRRHQKYLNKPCFITPNWYREWLHHSEGSWALVGETERVRVNPEYSREACHYILGFSIRLTVYFSPKPGDPEGVTRHSKSWKKKTFYHVFYSCRKF